jgi:hypothetical protein
MYKDVSICSKEYRSNIQLELRKGVGKRGDLKNGQVIWPFSILPRVSSLISVVHQSLSNKSFAYPSMLQQ